MVYTQAECNKTAPGNAQKSKANSDNEQESGLRRDQVTVTHCKLNIFFKFMFSSAFTCPPDMA